MTGHQLATIVCLLGFVVAVAASAVTGFELDIGVVLLGLGTVLALIDLAMVGVGPVVLLPLLLLF